MRRAQPSDMQGLRAANERAWEKYRASGRTREDLDELIRHYQPRVKRAVTSVRSKLPRHADWDGMEQAALLGLAEAIERYDPARGTTFNTYACNLIQARMFDGMRDADPLTRASRRQARAIEEAEAEFMGTHGRAASDADVGETLGISEKRVRDARVHHGAQRAIPFSLVDLEEERDSFAIEDRENDLHSMEEREAFEARLRQWGLGVVHRQILRLHHWFNLTQRRIGFAFDISETRVSQVLASIAAHVRGEGPLTSVPGQRNRRKDFSRINFG